LQRHRSYKHPDIKGSFQCSTCKESFSTAFLLSRHKTKFHSNNDFKCSHCPASFKLKKSLKHHVASVHNSHSLPCRYCEKRFKVKRFLRNHIRAVHPDEYSRTFENQHLKKDDDDDDERKHSCPKCNATFKTNSRLTQHSKEVHGPRNFPCPNCKMKFKRKGHLTTHVKNQHSSPVQRVESPELNNNPAH